MTPPKEAVASGKVQDVAPASDNLVFAQTWQRAPGVGLKLPTAHRVHELWPAKLPVSEPAGHIEQPISGLGLGALQELSEGFDVLVTVGPINPAGQVHVLVVIVTGLPIASLVLVRGLKAVVAEITVVANEFGMFKTGGP